jgi:hypothetical protein
MKKVQKSQKDVSEGVGNPPGNSFVHASVIAKPTMIWYARLK